MNQQSQHQGHSSYQSQQWSSSSYYQQRDQQQAAPPVFYQQPEYQQQATPQTAYQQQGNAQQATPQFTYPQSAQQTHSQKNEATTTTTVYEYEVPQPAYHYLYPSQTPAVACTAPVAQPLIQTQPSTAQYGYQAPTAQYAYQAPTSAPIPVQSPQQSTINYTSLVSRFEDLAPLSQAQPPPQTQPRTAETTTTIRTTTTQVETYEGEQAGGQTRREAAAHGTQALRRYERRVQRYLDHAVCDAGYPWRNDVDGYVCEGAKHFVSQAEIDAAIRSHDPEGLRVDPCNVSELGELAAINLLEKGEQLQCVQLGVHRPPFRGVDLIEHLQFLRLLKMHRGTVLSGSGGEGRAYGAPCECVRALGIPVVDDRGRTARRPQYRSQGAFQMVCPQPLVRRINRGLYRGSLS